MTPDKPTLPRDAPNHPRTRPLRTRPQRTRPLNFKTLATSAADTGGGASTHPDPRLIFAKTMAGTDAIRNRSQRVSLAARRLLLLFDGQRSLAQLPDIVRPNEVPTLLKELEAHGMITLAGMLADDASLARIHPDLKLAQIKRSLAGVFERELGSQASVLEARVQDCVNLVVLRNVLREVIALVAQRKNVEAADRIALLVKKHGPF